MRVLIVEDDPLLGAGLQIGLGQDGYVAEWIVGCPSTMKKNTSTGVLCGFKLSPGFNAISITCADSLLYISLTSILWGVSFIS
jgi:hypothetical protein